MAAAVLVISMLLLLAVPLVDKPVQAVTKTVEQTISKNVLQKGQQFSLTNMPYNGPESIKPVNYSGSLTYRGIQNFCYSPDGKYIFNIGECLEGAKIHSLLTRCKIPKKTGAKASAICEESVLLEGFGHGDSIAITQKNLSKEIYDIWVTCRSGSDGYARGAARLTYQVN